MKTIALTAGLALAGNAYTQETKDNSFYNRTGDFMLVSQYMNSIDKTKETSIESLLRGGNVTASYAIDAITGIKSRLQFLNSARAKSFYSDEERKLLIGRYNSFIAELAKEKRSSNYSKSLEQLSRAANDGTLSPNELKDVENGTYMLVKEGTDKKVGKYSLYALVSVGLNDSIKQEINAVKQKEDSTKQNEDSTKSGKIFTFQDNLFRDIFGYGTNSALKSKAKKSAKKTTSSLTLGVNSNKYFDNFGANVGFRVYPAGGIVGLGISADGIYGLDKNIESYTETLSSGRSVAGSKDKKNIYSAGLSGELQVGPLILGGGARLENSIIATDEKILKAGEVVKSNSNSVINQEVFGNVYAGIEVPVTKTFGLGATIGYDWGNGMFFGIKSNIKSK